MTAVPFTIVNDDSMRDLLALVFALAYLLIILRLGPCLRAEDDQVQFLGSLQIFTLITFAAVNRDSAVSEATGAACEMLLLCLTAATVIWSVRAICLALCPSIRRNPRQACKSLGRKVAVKVIPGLSSALEAKALAEEMKVMANAGDEGEGDADADVRERGTGRRRKKNKVFPENEIVDEPE